MIKLTPAQAYILQRLTNSKMELSIERGDAYLGYRRVSMKTVNNLLRKMALRTVHEERGFARMTINDTGREMLEQFRATTQPTAPQETQADGKNTTRPKDDGRPGTGISRRR